jgi:hypothetical protein
MCNFRGSPTFRMLIVRERWRASRLPSLRSALRGLDLHYALPICCGTYRSVGDESSSRKQGNRLLPPGIGVFAKNER